jgi:hypothetical protein
VAGTFAIVMVVLWRIGQLTLGNFLITLVLPVLIVAFQMLLDRYKRPKGKS